MTKRHHRSKSASARRRRPRLPPAVWIGLAAFVIIGAAVLLLRSTNTLPAEVDVARAYEMYIQGALLLDVRTQDEWDQGHIAGSLLMPLDDLPDRLSELPRDEDIVVVCRSGNRSKEGVTVLRDAGFNRTTCMSGGLQAWVAAGYPVQQ